MCVISDNYFSTDLWVMWAGETVNRPSHLWSIRQRPSGHCWPEPKLEKQPLRCWARRPPSANAAFRSNLFLDPGADPPERSKFVWNHILGPSAFAAYDITGQMERSQAKWDFKTSLNACRQTHDRGDPLNLQHCWVDCLQITIWHWLQMKIVVSNVIYRLLILR